ncbi:MAG: penicillin-binding protein 1A [Nitrospinota bacterium]
MKTTRSYFKAALIGGVISGGIVGYVFAWYSELPDIKLLQEFRPPVTTKVYSDDRRLIGEFFMEKRELIDYRHIPKQAINAVLATEDVKFFEHRGIRLWSLLRALIADIRAAKFVQGGSTITQQLAKTLFLTPEKSISRKIKEMLIALQIELNYTKKEILTLYFNQIYFGSGAYGLEAASKIYFNKRAQELTLAESALLAGLPRAPSYYSPHNDIQRSKDRRATVLKRMLDEGFITKEQKEAADAEEIPLTSKGVLPQAPYFLETIRRKLEEKYGSDQIYREGLEIYTTLNIEMQEAARRTVEKGLRAVESRNAKKNSDDDTEERPVLQAALIAIDPANGDVKALVGGRDFNKSEFNRAVQAKRQPGSAFKPVIYATALMEGWTPASILVDSPVILKDPTKPDKWKPENFSKKFYGPVTMRKALEKSLNVATIKLLQKVGADNVISMAIRLGIDSELHPYPSMALGVSELSLLEITSAYAVFANMGGRAEPRWLRLIRKSDGSLLEKNPPSYTEAMPAQQAFLITKMLQGVIENGTGRVAKKLGREAAAKTGTTDNFTDAWFIGYTPELATGVWVGYDMKKKIGKNETGAKAAGPIWTRFMKEALSSQPIMKFKIPEKIVAVDIEPSTGLLADPSCGKTVTEYFLKGTEPRRLCSEAPQRR